MASNHTPNYGLCQWVADDRVVHTDFNEDNAKIDAALGGLRAEVSGKADKTAVESLSASVAQNTETLRKTGNCQISFRSYVGTGKYGYPNFTFVVFPRKPLVVFIAGPDGIQGIFNQGETTHVVGRFGSEGHTVNVVWSANKVEWYCEESAAAQLNEAGQTYLAVGLMQTD